MKSHHLLAAMPPPLVTEILEYNFANDKKVYRVALEAVAQMRKLRPVFLERQPRSERHATMAVALTRPTLELAADTLIRNWLLKKYTPMLTDFLDALKISHEKGAVENLPASVEDTALHSAVETLSGRAAVIPRVCLVQLRAHAEGERLRRLGEDVPHPLTDLTCDVA